VAPPVRSEFAHFDHPFLISVISVDQRSGFAFPVPAIAAMSAMTRDFGDPPLALHGSPQDWRGFQQHHPKPLQVRSPDLKYPLPLGLI
jgi:hypothetical protein